MPPFSVLLLALLAVARAAAYPVDGFPDTGIRRLERLRLIVAGQMAGPKPPPGALRASPEMTLHLTDSTAASMETFPEPDSALQKQVEALFPDRHESYSVALIDLPPGRPPRYAGYQAERTFSPGSVGKLAIAAGLFAELKRVFPEDVELRKEVLRRRVVTAGDWVLGDHHDVPFFDPETKAFESRPIHPGDTFSLYGWADHMMSASANSAASTVWKEAMLIRAFGPAYPPTPEEEERFFRETPKARLGEMAVEIVNGPLREAGIAEGDWRLGSFFTKAGQRRVPAPGGSHGNPRGLLLFLMRLEQGRIVDPWSSLEIKRLMYMTAKRIRYASAPRLSDCAVYFKSGSLYRCKPEPDFRCRKYMGNVENAMNSVAIVERPDGRVYLVALMSNVLYKNSAVEHHTLATYIDRLLQD